MSTCGADMLPVVPNNSKSRVKLNVPATTANMGPGFDYMGMTMETWITIEVELSDRPLISIEGLGDQELDKWKENVVYGAVQHPRPTGSRASLR